MNSPELLKEAAQALRTLQSERNALIDKEESTKFALELTTAMLDSGKLSFASSLAKFAELAQKPMNELEIIKKAFELNKSSDIFKVGSLSDVTTDDVSDAREKFKNYILSNEE